MLRKEQPETGTRREYAYLQEQIWNRPKLGELEVGRHIRNPDEAADLWDLLKRLFPDWLYVGLAGGRQAGKIFCHAERIHRENKRKIPMPAAIRIAYEMPRLARNIDARNTVIVPGAHIRGSMPKAGTFIYDIDAVVVPREFTAQSTALGELGKRSGTLLNIIVASPESILRSPVKFFRDVFRNSQAIREPESRMSGIKFR